MEIPPKSKGRAVNGHIFMEFAIQESFRLEDMRFRVNIFIALHPPSI